MRKLRVGIITHNYPALSTERKDAGIFIKDFAHKLNTKVDVRIFCLNFEGKTIFDEKIPVTTFKFGKEERKLGNWNVFSPISIFKFIWMIHIARHEVIKFARTNKIDYCIAAWAIPSGLIADKLKYEFGIPYGIWCLGSDINKYSKYPILNYLIKRTLKDADDLYCNSLDIAEKVFKITRRKSVFLPSITNIHFSNKTLSKVKVPPNVFNFLFVGRLEFVKGPDILLEAVKIISKKNKKFHLTLAGSGSMQKMLTKKIDELNISSFITIVGNLNKKEVETYMKKCDSLVIPSRSESLPLVLLEASRAHLPIIATNVGDCSLLINKHKIGMVVDKNNPESLAYGMIKMLKKITQNRDTFNSNFQHINKEFTQKRSVEKLVSVIKRYEYST